MPRFLTGTARTIAIWAGIGLIVLPTFVAKEVLKIPDWAIGVALLIVVLLVSTRAFHWPGRATAAAERLLSMGPLWRGRMVPAAAPWQ